MKQLDMLCLLIKITAILLVIAMFILVITLLVERDSVDHVPQMHRNEVRPKNCVSTENYYDVTVEERELLARIVTCEASVCSIECQKAVCSVIFNRLESGKWKKDMNNDGNITLYDIIYYPNAFTPVLNGALDNCKTPCDSAYDAVDYVIKNGSTVPREVRYFRMDYDFGWEGYQNYCIIDDTYFGYFTEWENGAW